MAFKSKDGSQHTNISSMKSADARFGASQPAKQTQNPMGGVDDDVEETGDPQDGSALAAEHGPAVEIQIQHEGGHKVHATHPDGHTHDTDHESASAAHKFAGELADVGGEDAGGEGGGGMEHFG